MLRKDFLLALKKNQFDMTFFEAYFKEHSEKEWNPQAFHMWIQSQSMFGNVTGTILTEKIIPHYREKFNVQELLSKDGIHIMYVEN